MTVTLYGSPMSLYTGRVRSYFIKAGLDFSERHPVSDHYEDVVLAKAGGRRSMPTVELDSGEVIRDSVAIVDNSVHRSRHARPGNRQLVSCSTSLARRA
jgi:hypothetical protein